MVIFSDSSGNSDSRVAGDDAEVRFNPLTITHFFNFTRHPAQAWYYRAQGKLKTSSDIKQIVVQAFPNSVMTSEENCNFTCQ